MKNENEWQELNGQEANNAIKTSLLPKPFL